MKKLLLLFVLSAISINSNAQNISAARSAAVGSTVTVRGIITNGSELGLIRYLQDNSAGIAAYGGTASATGFTATTIGDTVSITGVTKLYSNLLEIDPVLSYTIHASGKPVPQAALITPASFNESVESQLIKIQNCTFSATGNFTTSSANYTVTSNSQTFVVRVVNSASSIGGTAIPSGPVDITGIASQFCGTPTSGCTTGYQLLPRTISDISAFSGINEIDDANAVKIFPNPATDGIIQIELQKGTCKKIEVINVLGTQVYSETNPIAVDKHIKLDLNNLTNGTYFVKLTCKEGIYIERFIIVK